ncbi:MAG TPA: peptidyl-tRNA hydrolase Pth2 [Candidatus Bilamarchaeaceae archaeon]|nr:peptidyl-tRNA hydrolase Pth2 [Candidatus Bilamarchaeaceae archaeon]
MYKQSIVVRSDLKLPKGKLAGQVSHASLSAFNRLLQTHPDISRIWLKEGQKKIVLKVSDEAELLEYFEQCKRAGIPCDLIQDAGLTQLPPGTVTCFAAGPWEEKALDKILGKLKLL